MEPKHTTFKLETDSGAVGYVLGDPNMSEKTREALKALIQYAYDRLADGSLEDERDTEDD